LNSIKSLNKNMLENFEIVYTKVEELNDTVKNNE